VSPETSFLKLAMSAGMQNWNYADVIEKSPWDHFGRQNVVILSPDATEPLETLSTDKVRIFLFIC
jgi:hypothetical protein